MVSWPRHHSVTSTASAPTATPTEIDNCCPTAISEVARLMRWWSTSAYAMVLRLVNSSERKNPPQVSTATTHTNDTPGMKVAQVAPWMMPIYCTAGTTGGAGTYSSNMRIPIDNERIYFYRLRWNYNAIPEDELSIFLARNGFVAAFPMAGHRFRLMATDPDHHSKDETAPTLGELQRVYDRVSPIPARLRDLVWSSRFRINSRHLTTLRVGRVFLGGDAAHIHSPAGGQGMNTGIQDMVNLCWKLALVLKGRGRPELLDTYEAERLPIITQLVRTTERATQLFNSTNWIVHQLLSRTAPFALAFDQVQANAVAAVGEVAASYRTGPLAAPRTRVGKLRSGDRVPDLELTTGTESHPVRLHQLLDLSGLTLLSTAADGRLPAGSLVVCTVTGNGLKDPDTAMTFMTEPVVLPVAAQAVTDALGLTG